MQWSNTGTNGVASYKWILPSSQFYTTSTMTHTWTATGTYTVRVEIKCYNGSATDTHVVKVKTGSCEGYIEDYDADKYGPKNTLRVGSNSHKRFGVYYTSGVFHYNEANNPTFTTSNNISQGFSAATQSTLVWIEWFHGTTAGKGWIQVTAHCDTPSGTRTGSFTARVDVNVVPAPIPTNTPVPLPTHTPIPPTCDVEVTASDVNLIVGEQATVRADVTTNQHDWQTIIIWSRSAAGIELTNAERQGADGTIRARGREPGSYQITALVQCTENYTASDYITIEVKASARLESLAYGELWPPPNRRYLKVGKTLTSQITANVSVNVVALPLNQQSLSFRQGCPAAYAEAAPQGLTGQWITLRGCRPGKVDVQVREAATGLTLNAYWPVIVLPATEGLGGSDD